ncbi:MAG: hypothetical protein QGI83_18180 [Candidatus Latescibacteria bacterium]|jgi:hypothetical protein|nr:hypothetical protein [Candidatus Latescibacterota bacterium]
MKQVVTLILILAVLLVPVHQANAGSVVKAAIIGVSVGVVGAVALHYAHKDMTNKQVVLVGAGVAVMLSSAIYMATVDTNPSLLNIGPKGKTLRMPRIKRTFGKHGSSYRVGLMSVRF